LDTIRDTNTILVIGKGNVVKVGTPDKLLAKIVDKKNTAKGEERGEEKGDKPWFREM
jgi:hypothetical protein